MQPLARRDSIKAAIVVTTRSRTPEEARMNTKIGPDEGAISPPDNPPPRARQKRRRALSLEGSDDFIPSGPTEDVDSDIEHHIEEILDDRVEPEGCRRHRAKK